MYSTCNETQGVASVEVNPEGPPGGVSDGKFDPRITNKVEDETQLVSDQQ